MKRVDITAISFKHQEIWYASDSQNLSPLDGGGWIGGDERAGFPVASPMDETALKQTKCLVSAKGNSRCVLLCSFVRLFADLFK